MFRILCFALLASATAAPAQDTSVRVWAAGDWIRISPVTGRTLEGRPDARAGSTVWDAAAKTVSLKAARNEFVAFQVIVEAGAPLDGIDVQSDGFRHPQGSRLEGRNVALFKEWYTQVRRPSTGYEKSSLGPDWYPDALMPYRKAGLSSGFPFSIPDLHNNIPNQRNHAVWVDIFVPYDRSAAPPGRYSGSVDVSWKGGKDTLRVVLDVWDFALPQENPLERKFYALGEKAFYYRAGPLDFSCSSCHGEEGKRIRLQDLPPLYKNPGDGVGIAAWPAYRVSNGQMWSMQLRLQDCLRLQRFPYPLFGSDVTIALAVYMGVNAKGAKSIAPALKR